MAVHKDSQENINRLFLLKKNNYALKLNNLTAHNSQAAEEQKCCVFHGDRSDAICRLQCDEKRHGGSVF